MSVRSLAWTDGMEAGLTLGNASHLWKIEGKKGSNSQTTCAPADYRCPREGVSWVRSI